MNWSIIFTIAIAVILVRAFFLRLKANSMKTEAFKKLPSADRLAILKECLLNNPTEGNLQNLAEFCQAEGIDIDIESYHPFMAQQLKLQKMKNALADDNALYAQESLWMDRLRPLEFDAAEKAGANRDTRSFVERTLEGISRLYSDEAIQAELEALSPHYDKAAALLERYRELMRERDESGADEASLEKLRKHRDAWAEDLLMMNEDKV